MTVTILPADWHAPLRTIAPALLPPNLRAALQIFNGECFMPEGDHPAVEEFLGLVPWTAFASITGSAAYGVLLVDEFL